MKNKEKNFISAVVYIHNAQNRIEKFLGMMADILTDHFEHSEIICVNDGSDDHSLEKIKTAGKLVKSTSISVINMSYFHGLESAMNAGIDLAIGDFVFEFDNTILDYDEAVIMNIYYRALKGGYDIVSAVPDKKEKLSSKLFYKVFDRFTDFSYKMHTERFRILSRRVINRMMSMNKAVLYRKVIYANTGLKSDTLVYKVLEGAGETDINKKEKRYRLHLAVDSLILFTEIGYRFAVAMTALMMFISVSMISYCVMVYVSSHPVAGWTTTISFLSVAFLGLFGILTIIIKYLQLLVDLVFKRKRYSVDEIEKLT